MAPVRQLVLSLDIGSSSVRAGLFDTNAKPVPRSFCKISHSFDTTPVGGSEMDADECFERVVAVIDEVMAKAERIRGDIIAVASCAIWHSLVGVDAKARPTTKVLGWADTRGRQYSSILKEKLDEGAAHEHTGAHFHSSFWPAKLLWLRRKHSGEFRATAKWLSLSDYVTSRLCGEAVTSVSMASATGVFDQGKCRWDAELLRELKVKRSQTAAPTSDSLNLKPQFAKRWPRLKSAAWLPAIGDGAADHVGSCGLGKNKASLMVGTSAAMRVAYSGEPPATIPHGLWCYRIDRERAIVGGALSDGGNMYALLRKTLRVPKDAEDQMRQRGAAAHGITVMPFFHGERSTGYRENARGEIVGFNASHDAVDILQAAMEAVAYRLSAVHDRLEKGGKIDHIVASGGALHRSAVWPQIIADVLGRDLLISSTPEAAMRGAVLLALESLGKIDSIDSFSLPAHHRLAFHPECHKAYQKARKRHEEFYKQTAKPT
jgi:gluconokinase